MDWLKNLVKNLPLDLISDIVTKLTVIWSKFVQDVPDEELPFTAYVGSSILVLVLLLFVVRVLPRPFGGIMWMLAVSILLTPSNTLTGSDQLAPAIAGVAHRILMKDPSGAVVAFLPILAVFIVLLFIGGVWHLLRGVLLNAEKQKANLH
ncbi:hypothetical protein [Moraxella oblonga]|uniref:hypothetical protein n=1 Tax=Moraxella oblonga TaxID=200413 RepID=UPI000ABB5F6C|nr:hypothetical protein [Moraxella oblonga]